MRASAEPLPIDPALPELTAALRAQSAAVLVAPPGAGKTTRVPLVLAAEPWAAGQKLIVLEPRRLAARAAAARMAATLGEPVGASVGYRVRFGSKVSAATRAERGSLLVFLPGAAEIRRTETLLRERIHDEAFDIVPLYGALDADVQDRAIAPASPGRRKIVLATSIAETSLTIEGVRVVVDCGLARVPRYEPDVGLTRLETVRVSRASAEQRPGRAGRTEPGVCYRLWDEPQTAALEPANRPEILAADLSGFVLDLAHWGVADPPSLPFLDCPPSAALNQAKSLLLALGAVDRDGRLTDEGRRLRRLPLAPRLARMVVDAAAAADAVRAAEIAVVLTQRALGGNDVDLAPRPDALRPDRSKRANDA